MQPQASRTTSFTTVPAGRDFRHELEIRKSRFITVLRRSATEGEARDLVTDLRREFHDARHHCSALVIGPDRTTQRSSDDGEPAGTAGIPMLEALLKRETAPGVTDLSDIGVVVVRYFGGVLLGAGGLVRAYSESVSAALDNTPMIRRSRLRICRTEVPHAAAGRLENDLRAAGMVMAETTYQDRFTVLRIAVPDRAEAIAAATDRIRQLTAGSAGLAPERTEWIDERSG